MSLRYSSALNMSSSFHHHCQQWGYTSENGKFTIHLKQFIVCRKISHFLTKHFVINRDVAKSVQIILDKHLWSKTFSFITSEIVSILSIFTLFFCNIFVIVIKLRSTFYSHIYSLRWGAHVVEGCGEVLWYSNNIVLNRCSWVKSGNANTSWP